MTAEKLADAILNKCDIYYGESLISKETIIEKYLSFFADSLVSKERTVNFALHTGSICFDVISVVAVALGCLSYNLSTNDDIIASLQTDDMVMFRGKRYRWKGIKSESGRLYITLEQDGIGKNGKEISYLPLENYKHLIKPYYGDSQTTDGRGVRKKKTNREDFLAFAFDMDMSDIPTQIDVSVVIVADRTEFYEICKQVKIVYGEGKSVGLLDIIPAAYYSGGGDEYQYGANPTKSEPVLKVTGKISTARDLVLDKHGNQVVGLLVIGGVSLTDADSELADLLRRKVLRFVHVTSPMSLGFGEQVLDMYEEASVFACTKEFLAQEPDKIQFANPLTTELYRQISNIVDNTVTSIPISNGWNWDEIKQLKRALLAIKQSNWEDASKDDFVVTAHGLINLLNTSVFTMLAMEQAVAEGVVNQLVVSPKARIKELWNIVDFAGAMQENCKLIADMLERKYQERFEHSPKEVALNDYIASHAGEKIAIVVPKAYYADILRFTHTEYFDTDDIEFVTANRLNMRKEYDAVMFVGDISNKRLNPLQCPISGNIDVLLYDCEEKVFTCRKQKQVKNERKLNRKIGIIQGDVNLEEDIPVETELESDIIRFSTLDEYIDNFHIFDIRKITQSSASIAGSTSVSEVKYVGTFTSGEQILFSNYYDAVVFDSISETVIEKSPEQLSPGDVLVFVKHNEYTKNIVDYIYEQLLQAGRLGQNAIEAYRKSQHWKEALRKYKDFNGFTYREVARKMQGLGSSMQEVTVRQWLIDGSHIVGPRKERTMEHIAMITQDSQILADAHGFFEACGSVRHDRRKILDLIAKAINDKLSGNVPPEGSVLSVVYENVDNLSETLELENISELDESVNVSINLVNTPITEAEVSM